MSARIRMRRAAYLVLLVGMLATSEANGTRQHRREHRRKHSSASDSITDLQVFLHPRRSHWQPRHTSPCNRTRHIDQPRVSALIQAFGDRQNAEQLAVRLHSVPSMEIIVNDDSRLDHAVWLRWLNGTNDIVLSSANVHEIRAYNRMARMARGDFLLILQGDHCIPSAGTRWLDNAFRLFEHFPRLGLLGGQMGFNQVPLRKIAEKVSWGTPPCKPIPLEAAFGVPFMFVAGVNIGPLLVRREAFLRIGGFDEAFSCVGEPGIQLDTELSLQMWKHGYQVGLWYSGVANGVGGRKTRTNRAQKRARNVNDAMNGQRCERLMRAHDESDVTKANAQLVKLGSPDDARLKAFEHAGVLDQRACRI
jgi:hypothetical protein